MNPGFMALCSHRFRLETTAAFPCISNDLSCLEVFFFFFSFSPFPILPCTDEVGFFNFFKIIIEFFKAFWVNSYHQLLQ